MRGSCSVQLPDRHLSLQPLDEETGGRERRGPVTRRHADHDRRFPDGDPPQPVPKDDLAGAEASASLPFEFREGVQRGLPVRLVLEGGDVSPGHRVRPDPADEDHHAPELVPGEEAEGRGDRERGPGQPNAHGNPNRPRTGGAPRTRPPGEPGSPGSRHTHR